MNMLVRVNRNVKVLFSGIDLLVTNWYTEREMCSLYCPQLYGAPTVTWNAKIVTNTIYSAYFLNVKSCLNLGFYCYLAHHSYILQIFTKPHIWMFNS